MSTPTLGFEDNTTLSSNEIALRQLCESINLFTDSRFLPALTLAGAAEEIFGKKLILRSIQPAVKESAQSILALRIKLGLTSLREVSEKDIIGQWNSARNTAKHLVKSEDELITLNLCDEAYWLIKRALRNVDLLGGTDTK
jgi:hypothetical protein